MSVTEIKHVSLLDVPAKLRALADEVERFNLRTVVVVIGYPSGKVAVRGYGERSSALMTTGWLARAQNVMTEDCAAADDDGYQWTPPGVA
jgi:hypothetical protein